ncbi:hypothetical protein Y695_02090 [Hydrogenophaga sp. T4]|nr:hypothetical protein Y695_02090 [Hydrogenophaga sp. T4]
MRWQRTPWAWSPKKSRSDGHHKEHNHGPRRRIQKSLHRQPAQDEPAAGRELRLPGAGRLHAGDAWFAGLHLLRPGAAGAPFQRGDPAADHGHERGHHHPRWLRKHRGGAAQHPQARRAQGDRDLLHRSHRNQGRRRRRLPRHRAQAPPRAGRHTDHLRLHARLRGRVRRRLQTRHHRHREVAGQAAAGGGRPGHAAARQPPHAERHRRAARDHPGVG